jgi:hypothetical protein
VGISRRWVPFHSRAYDSGDFVAALNRTVFVAYS